MNIPNFPTDSEYEYTDEDFIKDTQPFWVSVEAELREHENSDTNEVVEDTDEPYDYDSRGETEKNNEEYVEPDPYRNLPNIGFDWGRLDSNDRMRLLDQMRDSESGLYDEDPYDYDAMSPDEANYRFDNLDENRTPEGWFGDDD